MEYKHINDCWSAVREAETVDEVDALLETFPKWSGDWDLQLEYNSFYVKTYVLYNTHYDKDLDQEDTSVETLDIPTPEEELPLVEDFEDSEEPDLIDGLDEPNLIDDIDDFELLEKPITYEVWVLGYTENYDVTDFDVFIDGDYTSLEQAKECFDYFSTREHLVDFFIRTLSDVPDAAKRMILRLEATVEEEGGTTCVELIEEKEVL